MGRLRFQGWNQPKCWTIRRNATGRQPTLLQNRRVSQLTVRHFRVPLSWLCWDVDSWLPTFRDTFSVKPSRTQQSNEARVSQSVEWPGYGLDYPGLNPGKRYALLQSVQTGSGANPTVFKRLECEAGHSAPTMLRLRMCGARPILPPYFHGVHRHVVLSKASRYIGELRHTSWEPVPVPVPPTFAFIFQTPQCYRCPLPGGWQ